MLTPETDMLTQSPRMMWRFRPLRCVEDPAASSRSPKMGKGRRHCESQNGLHSCSSSKGAGYSVVYVARKMCMQNEQ